MTCSCMLELVRQRAVRKIFMLIHLCIGHLCLLVLGKIPLTLFDFLKQLDCRRVQIF